jgi:hypothetical protein
MLNGDTEVVVEREPQPKLKTLRQAAGMTNVRLEYLIQELERRTPYKANGFVIRLRDFLSIP